MKAYGDTFFTKAAGKPDMLPSIAGVPSVHIILSQDYCTFEFYIDKETSHYFEDIDSLFIVPKGFTNRNSSLMVSACT
jgi:hypothetical protein